MFNITNNDDKLLFDLSQINEFNQKVIKKLRYKFYDYKNIFIKAFFSFLSFFG